MQVSHATDHITHVVLGGKKNIEFGISDSPEFFAILSSALYKQPMLAMVRETICNAWDAHIEAGLNHKPIRITLDDGYLTIQDFGKGIPDALIGPIYAVYGASTKKNDGRQTGGFGLGCKSPFAYTDHFEVISCHAGVKTIYNMSKSSAEQNGKPGIVPIASFPTTETGVTVKIPLNPTKANSKLDGLIRQVVFNGDIKAMYNNGELPMLGLDNSEHGLVLLPGGSSDMGFAHHINTPISVRYGNVIYPVEISTEYKSLYHQVSGLLGSHYNCRLVVLAPANSLSITPSREALTMTDITCKTINDLLGKFLAVFMKNQQMFKRHKELLNEYIDEAAQLGSMELRDKLPMGDWVIPGVPTEVTGDVLSTLEDFAKLEVTLRATKRRKGIKATHWLKHIQRYFYKLNENSLFSQGLFQSWARTFQKKEEQMTQPSRYGDHWGHGTRVATDWWQKKILLPLVQSMASVIPNFNRKSLYYHSFHMISDQHYSKKVPKMVGYVQVQNHTQNLIHLITPTVILAHTATIVPKRISGLSRRELGSNGTFVSDTYFVYEVGRKEAELLAAREAFSKIPGIEFIDMTLRLDHEQRAYDERQEEIAKERADRAAGKVPKTRFVKKVKPGMVRLDTLIEGRTRKIDSLIFGTNTDPVRIVEPEAVAQISMAEGKTHNLAGIRDDLSYAIAKLYGDKVGVSNKSDAIERAKEKGAMALSEYVYTKITHDIENSSTLVAFHGSSRTKIQQYIEEKSDWHIRAVHQELISLFLDQPEFAPLAPDFVHLSDEDKYRWTIWENLRQMTDYNRRVELDIIKARVERIPLKPEVVTFLDKLISNEIVAVLSPEHITSYMSKNRQDPAAITKLVQLIETLLK